MQRVEAEHQRVEAEHQRVEAEHQRAEAEAQRTAAEAQKAEAQRQASLAEGNFREGQRTESFFRAEQAKQAGADAVTAALLALEGLSDPSADGAQRRRPFVKEAWYALYGARLAQRERAVLSGHTDAVRSAVFAPDGSRIVTASADGTARLWEALPETETTLVDRVKAELPRCLTAEQRQLLFLAFAPPAWCAEMHKWPYDGAAQAHP
jgi:hypothetical protein